jgi:hypothetical protein
MSKAPVGIPPVANARKYPLLARASGTAKDIGFGLGCAWTNRTSNGIDHVIMLAGKMIDAVAPAARGLSFKPAELIDALRTIQKLDALAVH